MIVSVLGQDNACTVNYRGIHIISWNVNVAQPHIFLSTEWFEHCDIKIVILTEWYQ